MNLKRASIVVISLFLILAVLYVHRESFKSNVLESIGALTPNEASSWSDNRLRFCTDNVSFNYRKQVIYCLLSGLKCHGSLVSRGSLCKLKKHCWVL